MATKKGNRKVHSSPSPPSSFSNNYINIRLSGAGDFLDVRFRVTESSLQPGPVFVKDEDTGKMITVATAPRVGLLMTRKVTVGKSGFLILQNYNNLIRSGSLVTLVVGKYIMEHVKVE